MPDLFVDHAPGNVDSDTFVVSTPTDVTVDFEDETDKLAVYRERRDGSFSPFLNGAAEVELNAKNRDNTIIVRPGTYKLVGVLGGVASCVYTVLP